MGLSRAVIASIADPVTGMPMTTSFQKSGKVRVRLFDPRPVRAGRQLGSPLLARSSPEQDRSASSRILLSSGGTVPPRGHALCLIVNLPVKKNSRPIFGAGSRIGRNSFVKQGNVLLDDGPATNPEWGTRKWQS